MSTYRRYVTGLGIVAAIVLFWMENPWFRPEDINPSIRTAATLVFWLVFIAIVVLMFNDRKNAGATEVQVEGPAFARYLFSNAQAGFFWLPIRLFVGFSWIEASWHKITGGGWLDGGAALLKYWQGAAATPEPPGRAPITFEWYRDFINVLISGHHETWFAWLVAFGELAIGVGLVLGALTGVAAFFGALMNMSFLLAGSGSSNPVLFTMAIGLILAWKVAGYYGVDRYLLPRLGTPWHARVRRGPVVAPNPAPG